MAGSSAGRRGWLCGPYSRLGLTVAVVTILLDQAHKWWMIAGLGMTEGDSFAMTPFLNITYVKNLGVSYGMLTQDGPAGQRLLALFAVVASLALTVWLARGATNKVMAWGIGLIIGGAIGNAIDRIVLGGVADFFSLHAFGFYWYVFNIADVAIVAGVVALLYDSWVLSRNDAANTP